MTVGTGVFAANIKGTFTNNNSIITKTATRTNSYSGTFTNASGSTVTFIGDGDSEADTFTITDFATAYYNLVIDSTDGATDVYQLGTAITVNNNATVTSGVLYINGQNFSPTGTLTVTDTLRMRGNETVKTPTLGGASTVEYVGTAGPYTLKNWTYQNLTINGAGATFNLPGNLDVNGNLKILAGTLDVTTSNYTLNVGGNWLNSGVFNQRLGTVILDGTSQKIFGSTTFYNLTKDVSLSGPDTLMFQNSETQSIADGGTLTLKGAANKVLTLRSCDASGNQSDGIQWILNVSPNNTTLIIDYVDVKDSDASPGRTIVHTNTINSGNNLNWGFEVEVSISVDDGNINFGVVALNSVVDNSNDIQVITVESGPADLYIKTSVFSDGENVWSLGSSNGENQVKWEFSKDGVNWTTFLVADESYVFDENVPQGATRNLYLRLTMPTSTSSYNQYGVNITIVASSP